MQTDKNTDNETASAPETRNNPNKNYAMYRAGAWTGKDSEREMLRLNNELIETKAHAAKLAEALRKCANRLGPIHRSQGQQIDDQSLVAEADKALAEYEAAQ